MSISTHHKRLNVVFTVSSEWMNYMYTLWLGSTHFPKTLKLFKKPRCQSSDTQDVHNLNFRHRLGVAARQIWKYLKYGYHLTHSYMWLGSMGTFERHSLYMFWRLYTLRSRLLLRKQINMTLLSVSKSVAWYQKYVHIKACVARRYIPRASGQVKIRLYLYLGRPTILRLRDIIRLLYHPSCTKWCKNW